MNEFPWTIFFILLAAGLFGAAAVMPYALAFNSKISQPLKEHPAGTGQPGQGTKPLPAMPVLVLLGTLQSGVLVAVTSFLGLLAARQVGLGTPILQTALEGGPVLDKILAIAPVAVLLALVSVLLLLLLEWFYFLPRIPRSLSGLDTRVAFWKRVLACFYGGIVEEILLRLFLMSVLAWLASLIWQAPAAAPAPGAYWVANILAALLFGAGHLPATSQITKLTPIVVARALLLNGLAGVAFGFLYMQYGLEAAMLSHFSADILIHLIAPLVTARRLSSLPPEPAIQTA